MTEKLSTRIKWIYGSGDLGFSLTNTILSVYFALFLTDVVGVKPSIAALSIKSVAVLREYWDTGVAILLFAEMAQRAIAKSYQWADLSLTGEDNPDTSDLAHHMGAKIYKRYRFYKKEI